MSSITSKKLLTLILVLNEKEQKILLGMKKRGFGVGLYNGFGGKVEPGETIEEGARRELLEESELEAVEMEKIGNNLFTFENDPVGLDVHIYTTTRYLGEPHETEEMNPEWFAYADIPFHQMWPDDRLWFPYVFNKTKFTGHFHFAQDQKTILSQELIAVQHLD
ncbi:NUDIX hydrolase domain-like protein [Mucor mucedo]|uniref:NUDIX hydrolase domain-like protein n=1 Tax=Mucor mucedo TaxID=29922 RepID=UPI00221ED33C|nr:NUDIX hydrolase domain-like protein [Mucor mucedo]KAI7890681.1 NUDIX hydrolase domain-like protein [Mucor mucedo]